jgi:predicted ester cyclase
VNDISGQKTTEQLEANKALVRRLLLDGFSGGHIDVIEDVMSPDIELHDDNLPPGIEGVKAIVRKNNAAFDDWSFAIHDELAADNKVAVRWTATGIHANAFMGEEPTGKEVCLKGIAIFEIARGKIVSDWVVPDNLQFLIQLGVIPPLGITHEPEPVG